MVFSLKSCNRFSNFKFENLDIQGIDQNQKNHRQVKKSNIKQQYIIQIT